MPGYKLVINLGEGMGGQVCHVVDHISCGAHVVAHAVQIVKAMVYHHQSSCKQAEQQQFGESSPQTEERLNGLLLGLPRILCQARVVCKKTSGNSECSATLCRLHLRI